MLVMGPAPWSCPDATQDCLSNEVGPMPWQDMGGMACVAMRKRPTGPY